MRKIQTGTELHSWQQRLEVSVAVHKLIGLSRAARRLITEIEMYHFIPLLHTERIADWDSIPTPIMTRDFIFSSLRTPRATRNFKGRWTKYPKQNVNFVLYFRISECLTADVFIPLLFIWTHICIWWNEKWQGKPKYCWGNLFHCHFVHHKSHVIELWPPRWDPSD